MDKNAKRVRAVTWAAFVLYLILLVWVIVFKTDPYSVLALEPKVRQPVNLIPFGASVVANGSVYVPEIVENALVFIPLGLFISMLSKRGGVWKSVLIGLALSLAFEAAQYAFAIGCADITDVIMNNLGALLGALLWLPVKKLLKGRAEAITGAVLLCAELLFIGFALFLTLANLNYQ